MKPYTYLIIDVFCIIVPFIASFYPKRAFYKKWKSFLLANILVAVPFLVWDAIFTEIGVWGFNPDYLTGIYFFGLPVEEILFFFCIPYACVFTHFALQYLINKNPLERFSNWLTYFFMVVCIVFITVGFDKKYTFFTGLFTLLFLVFIRIRKVNISDALLTYFCIIPFFLLSNGILTGSFLEEPIVWYNNQENLAVRMFTIPVEDSIYGFLLIMLNIVLFDFFNKKLYKQSEAPGL
ncbi:lycopene cyclase domain-containing protein [Flavobacterium rhizosphaerae]|uniref:Lycopene cyclase domain-containing protein n=1 Tax=Flavobacterium rhizosphaerae TaxID=3163298 RepID=A0ABW8YX04_9FLAO